MTGEFPIGFSIWETFERGDFVRIEADVYDRSGVWIGKKFVSSNAGCKLMTDWVASEIPLQPKGEKIGFLAKTNSNDFQNNKIICILNKKEQLPNPRGRWIDAESLIISCVYLSVRQCMEATWLNDRDQFLYPNDGWKTDGEFRGDCLVYTLFHGQNRISCEHGVNHWIPFTEEEVGAQDCFASHFMSDFLKGDGAKVRAFLCGEPVARLTGHEFEGLKGVGVIRDAVYESYARVNWQSENPQLGTVSLTKSGINDSLWHGFGRLKLSAFACVPEIIAGGVVVDESRDWKGRGYDSYVIAAPIAIAGEPYCALVVANQRKAGGFRFYLHEVASIAELKKRTEGFRSGSSDCSALSSTPGSMKSLAFSIFAVNGGAENDKHGQTGFVISTKARDVLDAGRELWRYYHAQPGARANAAYYDIRKHFQGVKVDAKGKEKMNATSGDAAYNERLAALKAAMTTLAAKIRPKVFDYGFLK